MAYVIPTAHPAHVLRGAPISDQVIADIGKAYRVSMQGPVNDENLVVVHPSHPVGLETIGLTAIAWLQQWRSTKCPIAIDVETSSIDYMSARLYSIALSGVDGNNAAVAFTFHDLHTLPWNLEQALTQELKYILQDASIPKVMQNAPFDSSVLSARGYRVEGPFMDTMAYAHMIQPDAQKDLGWIGHQYLDVEPWKLDHEGKKTAQTEDIIELLTYNAKDALNTGKALTFVRQEAAERGMSPTLEAYQMALQKQAGRMQVYGIPINMSARAAMGEELKQKMHQCVTHMRDWMNWPELVPTRDVMMREALYSAPKNGRNYLNLPILTYTPTDHLPSTSYKAFADYLEHPFIKSFTDYKEARAAFATIFQDEGDFDFSSDGKPGAYAHSIYGGRIHVKWNPNRQKGSRFSSSPNVQNIKLKYRVIFQAPHGRAFVGADKDQLELRIIACRAGVRELVEEIRKPKADPHRLSASIFFGEAFKRADAKGQKKLRNLVKNVVYASLYNAGPNRVFRTLREKKELPSRDRAELTKDLVTYIHKSFFGRFTEINRYHEANYLQAMTHGYNECEPLGRRRYFPVQPPEFTEVGNWKTQTEGSDHVNKALIHLQEDFDKETKGDAMIILHGHDSLAAECAAGYAERAAFLMNHHFGNDRIEGPAGAVHLTAKASIGQDLLAVK
jgi:DNA polymerase-1